MFENIIEYQKIDSQLRVIETELSATEERKRVRACLQFLKESDEKLKKMENDVAEINTKCLALKEQYEANCLLLTEYEKGVRSAIDQDELNYLKKKFADLVKTINGIEKDMSALSQEAANISRQFEEIRAKLPQAKKQYSEAKDKFDALRKEREPEVSALQRKKAEIEKHLSPEILTIYKELKAQNVTRPFVPLEEPNRCGGCRMDLPVGKLSAVSEKGYIRCENCHRIIYKQ